MHCAQLQRILFLKIDQIPSSIASVLLRWFWWINCESWSSVWSSIGMSFFLLKFVFPKTIYQKCDFRTNNFLIHLTWCILIFKMSIVIVFYLIHVLTHDKRPYKETQAHNSNMQSTLFKHNKMAATFFLTWLSWYVNRFISHLTWVLDK